MPAAHLDLLGFVGLTMTAIVVAVSLIAYLGVRADAAATDQELVDRRFYEIVARFDG